jgi:hypothetical protein
VSKTGAQNDRADDRMRERLDKEFARLNVVGMHPRPKLSERQDEALDEALSRVVIFSAKLGTFSQKLGTRIAEAKGSWPAKEIAAINKTLRHELEVDIEELGSEHRRTTHTFADDLTASLSDLAASVNELFRLCSPERRKRKRDGQREKVV